jgi:probable HAF family extracellular repeat protein
MSRLTPGPTYRAQGDTHVKRLFVVTALVLSTAPAVPAQVVPGPTRYFVFDVGRIAGDITPFRLNQSGTMVWNSGGRAFTYRNCTSRDLGHLGGGRAVARSINNNGVVVGKSLAADGRWRAFTHSNGVMHDLGGASQPLIWEEATAINFWGDVVGVESVQGTLALTGVRYLSGAASPMAPILLTPPSGSARPMDVADINDSRDVAAATVSFGNVVALRSSNFGHLWTVVKGVPGLEFSTLPQAMNRYGHIAGIAGNLFVRGFISRDPGQPAEDLGTLGGSLSAGMGINNYGAVVGWAEKTDGGGPRAFVHDGAQMVDLNDRLWNGSGWLLVEATAINDAGQIAGNGVLNGERHAFFLQPMQRYPLFSPCGGGVIGGVSTLEAR